jgi:hypothetical protein
MVGLLAASAIMLMLVMAYVGCIIYNIWEKRRR